MLDETVPTSRNLITFWKKPRVNQRIASDICPVSRMLVAGLLLLAPLVTADPVRVIETNSFRSEAPPQSRCLLLLLLLQL